MPHRIYKTHYILFLILFLAPMAAHAGVLDYLESIWQFISNFWTELKLFAHKLAVKVITWLIIKSINFTIYMLYLSWEVAKEVISQIGITEAINNTLSNLDSRVLELVLYFDVPDHLNAVLSSMMTRYIYGKL